MNATRATGAGVVATIPGAASGGILHIVYIYKTVEKRGRREVKFPTLELYISTMIYDTQL